MSFPKDCEDEFLKIFHEEIHRQRIETKPCTSIKKIDDFTRFISYRTAKYISDFNTIMYNQLLKQVMHNERIKVKKVDQELKKVKLEALEFYDTINSNVDSDEAASKHFLQKIIFQQMKALQKYWIEKFSEKMKGVVINKTDLIAESIKRF